MNRKTILLGAGAIALGALALAALWEPLMLARWRATSFCDPAKFFVVDARPLISGPGTGSSLVVLAKVRNDNDNACQPRMQMTVLDAEDRPIVTDAKWVGRENMKPGETAAYSHAPVQLPPRWQVYKVEAVEAFQLPD